MPTFAHEPFIVGLLTSIGPDDARLGALIVDDGSPMRQKKPSTLSDRSSHQRGSTQPWPGAALNVALDHTSAPLIAYLPSDDVYYPIIFSRLSNVWKPTSKRRWSVRGGALQPLCRGAGEGYPLQLVQVMHRRTADSWLDGRTVTDLDRMYWRHLRNHGEFLATGNVTCEWVHHPDQLHTLIQEPVGGINLYRQRFQVSHPLRFHTTVGNAIDEVEQYRRFRERPDTPRAPDGLKVLLVGELAYNADRILALEERGHKLYGLWMPEPYWYNTVGPVPFGHVEDIPRADWQRIVRQLCPDVIYALLNWQAVPFAHEVLRHNPGIPFVWHFKEGPFICLEKGTWPQLVDLYARCDGQIYSSPEMAVVQDRRSGVAHSPPLCSTATCRSRARAILPADLRTGELHTVVPGRPIGLHPHTIAELAAARVHVHFYGDFMHGQWRAWIEKALGMADGHLHLHAHIDQKDWVSEFSRYDAGWLHFFASRNHGDLRRADWDDLNYPARISTLVAAGLPLLQRDNRGSLVATQTLVRDRAIGLLFSTMEELGGFLRQRERMDELRANVLGQRHSSPSTITPTV